VRFIFIRDINEHLCKPNQGNQDTSLFITEAHNNGLKEQPSISTSRTRIAQSATILRASLVRDFFLGNGTVTLSLLFGK
jgi:hypothetical protein